MTLYAVLVFVFDTFPVSLCKGKVKTKEKRQTKENKRAFGTLWPSALFACAIQEPATSAHHASRGGTRRRRRPSPRSRPHTCRPIAHASVRSDPLAAHLVRASLTRLTSQPIAHAAMPSLCNLPLRAGKHKMGRASIVAKLTGKLGCAPNETRIQN